MKKLIFISLICLMAGAVLADDDGSAFGCWNTSSVDYGFGIEASWYGGVYAFPQVAGTDTTLDSTSLYLLCDTADKYVSLALYRILTGTGLYFVDSTGPVLVTANVDTQWVTFDWINDSALYRDTVYIVVAKAEDAAGVCKVIAQDSTGTGVARRAETHVYTDAWEVPTWGGTSNTNNIAILLKNYYGGGGEPPADTVISKYRNGDLRSGKYR